MNIRRLISSVLGHRVVFILIVCTLAGFALRLYTFDQKSLWIDEIYTLNDSKFNLKQQIEFYGTHPNYPQAPLFFLLTHVFYPFTHPERDLRLIPILFGTLSIPMIFFLARSFSPGVALPCTLSLTFLTYHISLSQDARSYAMVMFLGMAGLFFFMTYQRTLKKRDLLLGAFFYASLFYASYSSIVFILFSQSLWFYPGNQRKHPGSGSALLLFNGFLSFLCAPWILFLLLNYRGHQIAQWISHPFEHTSLSLGQILFGILHDWAPQPPTMILSAGLILYALLLTKEKKIFLLGWTVILPIMVLYFFCVLTGVTHFFVSRYFISFLPLFFITLYLSIHHLESRWPMLKHRIHLKRLFLVILIAANGIMLPLYYQSEKQDFRNLASFLKMYLQAGDKIIDLDARSHGILHYFGVLPAGRFYYLDAYDFSKDRKVFQKSFLYQNQVFTIYHSDRCCDQYLNTGNRLWIITGVESSQWVREHTPAVLKGYFDGSYFHGVRFPTDASMYLFLWDPQAPHEKEMDSPLK